MSDTLADQAPDTLDHVDAVVVGAGVVGLAVARALAQAGLEVVVLEREHAIGTGISSRNSEVIHAGLYYTPDSLKARLCVRGKTLLYAYCASHGVAHQQCGKLIVATDTAQLAGLKAIAARADANAVPVQWLSAEEACALEPALRCVAALWSPTTGIVDSHGLMLALQGDLEAAGGAVALGSRLVSAERVPQWQGREATSPEAGWLVQVAAQDSVSANTANTLLGCRYLVNAAGLYASEVAQHIEGMDPDKLPRTYFAKGNYYTLSGRAPFSRLIYPAPQDAWLGVHLTLDLGGQAKFGPDLEWLAVERPEDIDYAVDPQRAEAFYAEVRRYWPALPDGALQPSYSGVRPKLYGPGQAAPDFRIDGPAQHGLPGLVNLLGIESPGLTSALAIGEYVAEQLQQQPVLA